jgi:hypothetical protein
MAEHGWRPGDVIAQEGYNAATNKLIEVRPATVIEDSVRALVLYFPAGSTFLSGDSMLGSRRYERSLDERVAVFLDPAPLDYSARVSPRHVLSLLPTDAMHAVWFFWDAAWNPTHCFVNLQARYVRGSHAIQVTDYYLDIAASTSLDWRWKDVDEFEAMCAAGAFTSAERAVIWAEAGRVAAAIDARAWPFDDPWPRHLVRPEWPMAVLHERYRALVTGDTAAPAS